MQGATASESFRAVRSPLRRRVVLSAEIRNRLVG